MRALEATCSGQVVTVEDLTVEATILSEGVKDSEGVFLLDKDKAFYVASNATDIKDVITALGDIIDKISQIVTSLDAVTNSPGAAAANIALLATLKTQFMLIKDNLK